MKRNQDLSKILNNKHERKWVALTPDHSEIIAYGDDLVRVSKEAGSRDVVYMKVPPSDTYLTF
jgi:hypothetical protein